MVACPTAVCMHLSPVLCFPRQVAEQLQQAVEQAADGPAIATALKVQAGSLGKRHTHRRTTSELRRLVFLASN